MTKALAKEMLADDSIEPKFFMFRAEVPPRVVEQIVSLDSGEILWWLAGRLDAQPTFQVDTNRAYVGIYPSTKKHRRLFPKEVLIVHDLTTVIAPQFHTSEAVKFWQEQLLADMLTSDLIVAVSESTKADIRTYFPEVGHIPCIASPLGPCVVPVTPLDRKVADYALVLGTLEPRKNVAVILECLSQNQDLLSEVRFVFVGGWGWGETAGELVLEYGLLEHVTKENIVFTGFVSDRVRDALVSHARMVIYPSRYEGFGLPVLESLTLGTPVLTSYSSSLPEVGGDVAEYCDFESPESLVNALKTILSHPRYPDEARKAWAAQFSWTKTYREIKDAALADAMAG